MKNQKFEIAVAGYDYRFKTYARDGVEASVKVKCFLGRPDAECSWKKLQTAIDAGVCPTNTNLPCACCASSGERSLRSTTSINAAWRSCDNIPDTIVP